MSTDSAPMQIAISGASGLVGSALCPLLTQQGHNVVAIRRGDGGSYEDSIRWDPNSGLTNPARLESVDAIVHLDRRKRRGRTLERRKETEDSQQSCGWNKKSCAIHGCCGETSTCTGLCIRHRFLRRSRSRGNGRIVCRGQ